MGLKQRLIAQLRKRVSAEQRRHLLQLRCRLLHPAWLGTLRRTTPLSDYWGFDRGDLPIDRFYIEKFMEQHRQDIKGHVLEINDSNYTNRFGSDVQQSAVLDINPANSQATIVADLAKADEVTSEQFDCFILTQTLQFIYDVRAAIAHAHRMLRPGGVLLVTVPAVTPIGRSYLKTDLWRFTQISCKALFEEAFGPENVTVRPYGNVLISIAFLTGMAKVELSRRELEVNDEQFPLIITVRAVKS